MNFQRLLELCDVLGECEFLPPGNFYRWAQENARREITQLYAASLGVKFVVSWPSGGYAQDGGYVESSR